MGYPAHLVGIAGAAATLMLEMMYKFKSSEHLETAEPVINETVVYENGKPIMDVDTDDNRYSEFGNISLMDDIDSTYQRRADLDFTVPTTSSGDRMVGEIDNSDMVAASMMKGSSLFLPNHSDGVSTTSSAQLSSFTLGEPDPINRTLSYTSPTDDSAYNLDQALARKQQHRASMNKRAIDGAVRSTKNLYQRVFQNELAEGPEREWWSAESTDFETDFRTYY